MVIDETGLKVGSKYIMYRAEEGLMQFTAKFLLNNKNNLDVLEIGYGLGIFAEAVQDIGFKTYTTVEIHPELIQKAKHWKDTVNNDQKIKIVEDAWQNSLDSFSKYDCIMYDSCPPPGYDEKDFDNIINVICKFFLKKGGRFSFFCSGVEIKRSRLELINSYFDNIKVMKYTLEKELLIGTVKTKYFMVPICTK